MDENKECINVKEGRWTKLEKEQFVQAVNLYGKNWKKINGIITTRSVSQIRSHAQKYFKKMTRIIDKIKIPKENFQTSKNIEFIENKTNIFEKNCLFKNTSIASDNNLLALTLQRKNTSNSCFEDFNILVKNSSANIDFEKYNVFFEKTIDLLNLSNLVYDYEKKKNINNINYQLIQNILKLFETLKLNDSNNKYIQSGFDKLVGKLESMNIEYNERLNFNNILNFRKNDNKSDIIKDCFSNSTDDDLKINLIKQSFDDLIYN